VVKLFLHANTRAAGRGGWAGVTPSQHAPFHPLTPKPNSVLFALHTFQVACVKKKEEKRTFKLL